MNYRKRSMGIALILLLLPIISSAISLAGRMSGTPILLLDKEQVKAMGIHVTWFIGSDTEQVTFSIRAHDFIECTAIDYIHLTILNDRGGFFGGQLVYWENIKVKDDVHRRFDIEFEISESYYYHLYIDGAKGDITEDTGACSTLRTQLKVIELSDWKE